MTDQFYNNYVPEQEQTYNHTVVFEGKKVVFDIADTKGKNSALISHADAVLLVFSITDSQSFDHAKELLTKVKDLTFCRTPIILVANKCDKGNSREVPKEQYQHLSEVCNLRCFEVSAAIPTVRLDVVFEEVYYQVYANRTRTRTFSNPNSAVLQRKQIPLGTIHRRRSVSMEEGVFRNLIQNRKEKKKKHFSLPHLI